MNKTKYMCIFSPILLAIIMSFSALAYTPTWKIDIENNLSGYQATFTAGAGSGATDGYDPQQDAMSPFPPPGKSVAMLTGIDGHSLMVDYREDIIGADVKSWEITLFVDDDLWQGLSGTNIITWNYDSLPQYLSLTLIDYGNDNSRTNIVNTIDMQSESSYEFDVTNALGQYRYLDLIVNGTECVEDWTCTDWSVCRKKTQTRTCTDQNNCGTVDDKPAESQECKGGGPPSGGGGTCTPKWKCGKWSDCIDNERTRECTDQRKCGDDSSKPDEVEDCVSEKGSGQKTAVQLTGEETPDQTTTTGKEAEEIPETILKEISKQGTNPLIGFLIMIVIVGVGLGLFLLIGRK